MYCCRGWLDCGLALEALSSSFGGLFGGLVYFVSPIVGCRVCLSEALSPFLFPRCWIPCRDPEALSPLYPFLFPTAGSCWVSISGSNGGYRVLPSSGHAQGSQLVFTVCRVVSSAWNLGTLSVAMSPCLYRNVCRRLPVCAPRFPTVSLDVPVALLSCLPLCLSLCFPTCFSLEPQSLVCHRVAHLENLVSLCSKLVSAGSLSPTLSSWNLGTLSPAVSQCVYFFPLLSHCVSYGAFNWNLIRFPLASYLSPTVSSMLSAPLRGVPPAFSPALFPTV